MSLLPPQLEAFMAVVHHKTVHGAANSLHLTQTAVTQRVRTLETKLSTTLFARTKKGMVITPEGEALLRYCQSVKALEGEALAKIKGTGLLVPIEISICGPSSIMLSRIVNQCAKVIKKFSNLLLNFNICDREDRHHQLRMGKAQFAILKEESASLEMKIKPLKPEKYRLVCSSKWRGKKLEEIISSGKIIDYNPEDEMTFNYLRHYGLFENANHERHFANNPEALAMLIYKGYGYGVLTEEFSQHYIDSGKMIVLNQDKSYENHIVLAWYDRPTPPTYFSEIIRNIV